METNYIKLNVIKGMGFFQYHVTFEPALDSKHARFVCLNKLSDVLGKAKTFDGATLCLPQRLPDPVSLHRYLNVISCDKHSFQVTELISNYEPAFPEVKVTIALTNERPMGHPTSIYLYNNLFRKIMRILQLVEVNRNHFDPTKASTLPHLK